jgi:hypothetical protein
VARDRGPERSPRAAKRYRLGQITGAKPLSLKTLQHQFRPAIDSSYIVDVRNRRSGRGCSMPRYYFDLVDDETVYDKKGVSLPNIKAAEEYAATFARELMETKPTLMGEAWKAWSVQICNGKFERILKIPFAQIKDRDRSASDDASQPA